jgi:lipopolysaccharide transport system permease protein
MRLGLLGIPDSLAKVSGSLSQFYFSAMELHITPKRPSLISSWQEIVVYRDLLWILAYREISVRYKQTAIGFLWVVLQPVISTVLFTVIFGHFAKFPTDGIPSGLFFFCGMTLWGLFSNIVTRAGGSVLADERLITKVYFPRAIIPLSSVFSAGFDFLITLVILAIMAACYGFAPGIFSLAFLPATLIVILSASGVGTALAGWSVRYRDFRYIIPFLVQIGLYASPIVYPVSLIPAPYRFWYYLNPMTGSLELFRYATTGTTPIHLSGILVSTVVSLLLFLGGALVFRQVEKSFADTI